MFHKLSKFLTTLIIIIIKVFSPYYLFAAKVSS